MSAKAVVSSVPVTLPNSVNTFVSPSPSYVIVPSAYGITASSFEVTVRVVTSASVTVTSVVSVSPTLIV